MYLTKFKIELMRSWITLLWLYLLIKLQFVTQYNAVQIVELFQQVPTKGFRQTSVLQHQTHLVTLKYFWFLKHFRRAKSSFHAAVNFFKWLFFFALVSLYAIKVSLWLLLIKVPITTIKTIIIKSNQHLSFFPFQTHSSRHFWMDSTNSTQDSTRSAADRRNNSNNNNHNSHNLNNSYNNNHNSSNSFLRQHNLSQILLRKQGGRSQHHPAATFKACAWETHKLWRKTNSLA